MSLAAINTPIQSSFNSQKSPSSTKILKPKPSKVHKKRDSGFSEEITLGLNPEAQTFSGNLKEISYSSNLTLTAIGNGTTFKNRQELLNRAKTPWEIAPLHIALKWKGFSPEAQFRKLKPTKKDFATPLKKWLKPKDCKSVAVLPKESKPNHIIEAKETIKVDVIQTPILNFIFQEVAPKDLEVQDEINLRNLYIEKIVQINCENLYLRTKKRVLKTKAFTKSNSRKKSVSSNEKLIRGKPDFEHEEREGWKKIKAFKDAINKTTASTSRILDDIDFYLEETRGWDKIDEFYANSSKIFQESFEYQPEPTEKSPKVSKTSILKIIAYSSFLIGSYFFVQALQPAIFSLS
ncbi:hypothetical protein G9A89_012623 [Geosiphon pyriformis]|nr:hypothetical protein G9A89_012623 [Geosiphon pyriformis]